MIMMMMKLTMNFEGNCFFENIVQIEGVMKSRERMNFRRNVNNIGIDGTSREKDSMNEEKERRFTPDESIDEFESNSNTDKEQRDHMNQ